MDTSIDAFEKGEGFSFFKNLSLVVVFFALTPLTILMSLFSLVSLNNSPTVESKTDEAFITLPLMKSSGAKVYASLPGGSPELSGKVNASDARAELVREYLKDWNSPLVPYADFIVSTADKYGVDFRLTTAIAQKESNLCKIIPPGTYNCWGWGIHSEGTLGFSSYEQGIEEVTKGLKQNYIDKGYVSPDQIMAKYTPLSNGSWAEGVNEFMGEMQ